MHLFCNIYFGMRTTITSVLQERTAHGESKTTFLNRLVKKDPEIWVLLDVGAQMLKIQNEALGRCWLSLRPDISAAIYFNILQRSLQIIGPDGTIELLISSLFNRQLEKSVLYVDDAHTRGTDLELTQGMRAAVTLGSEVTKDRLVQSRPIHHVQLKKMEISDEVAGCMRMCQLGKCHSVTSFALRAASVTLSQVE
jgi:hypothetical protein